MRTTYRVEVELKGPRAEPRGVLELGEVTVEGTRGTLVLRMAMEGTFRLVQEARPADAPSHPADGGATA